MSSMGGTPLFVERIGYIVWFSDWKAARGLEKYGTVHYMSRRMHYAVMYLNADTAEETVKLIERLPYVRKVERSYRHELEMEFNRSVPDKTRFFGP